MRIKKKSRKVFSFSRKIHFFLLTLETECKSFHNVVSKIVDACHNLEWITICAAERDCILKLDNGVFIEYWDRNIHQCDFDAALIRSQQIIQKKQKKAIC